VAVFEGAAGANGDTTPNRYIQGDQTGMIDPNYSACYVAGGDLYVGDEDGRAIHIFNPASSVNGNTAPTRRLTGDDVPFQEPQGVAVDTALDILYVVDQDTQMIYAWHNASTVNGNVAPDRTIDLGRWTYSLCYDQTMDRFYISGGSAVLIFENASGLDGEVVPDRVVKGDATGLRYGFIAIDLTRDRLYVSNSDEDKILVFNNLDTMDGDVPPLHVIEGDQTGFSNPMDLCIDQARDHLYSLNDSGRVIRVWHNAAQADGNVPPDRMISNGAGMFEDLLAVFFLNN
jgi:hypothetical protein